MRARKKLTTRHLRLVSRRGVSGAMIFVPTMMIAFVAALSSLVLICLPLEVNGNSNNNNNDVVVGKGRATQEAAKRDLGSASAGTSSTVSPSNKADGEENEGDHHHHHHHHEESQGFRPYRPVSDPVSDPVSLSQHHQHETATKTRDAMGRQLFFPRGKWTRSLDRLSNRIRPGFAPPREGITEHEAHIFRKERELSHIIKPALPSILSAALLLNAFWIPTAFGSAWARQNASRALLAGGFLANIALLPFVSFAFSQTVKWRQTRRLFVQMVRDRLAKEAAMKSTSSSPSSTEQTKNGVGL